jgi:ribosomal-protein-alanine N-acetyltransferase
MVFLEVRPSNLAAVQLYQTLGFNEIGVRRGYYPTPRGHEDAQVMALDLRQDSAAVHV